MGNLQTKVLVLGLDGAGKTAIVNYLASKGQATTTVEPTTGYTLKDIKYKGCNFGMWDVAGKENLRGLWKHYYEGTDALVWVIDSSDPKRFEESMEWLRRLMGEPQLQNAVVLVLANKQDMPGAASQEAISKLVEPVLGEKRKWYLQPCSITNWDGVQEGFKWLSSIIKTIKKGK